MTTTTEEYWSVIAPNGTEYPLNTFAKNIETWGEDRNGVVPLRGEDDTIPWIPGDKEQPRVPASRTMTMAMWVHGSNDDGLVPNGSSRRQQFVQNWRLLQRIFHAQGLTYTLRKRFYDESYTLRIADARVKFDGTLTPSMMGRTGAKFTVDLKMADPFFYSTTAVNIALDSSVAGGVVTPTVIGDYDVRRLLFTGTAGGAGASAITLEALGHLWAVDGSANAGESLMFDMTNQLARINDVNRTGGVRHTGSNDWLRLAVGTNPVRLSCSTGSCTGTLSYRPVWN